MTDHDELLKGVMDFTGCSKEKAMVLLEQSGWSVPEAVTRFFNEVQPVNAAAVQRNSGWREVLLAIWAPVQGFIGWVVRSVWNLLKLFFGGPQVHASQMRNGSGSLAQYFASLASGYKPICIDGDFASALTHSRARDNRRVLILFLGNADSSEFVNVTKKVICDESVASVIAAQFLFWAGDTNYRQVDHLRKSLPVRASPMLVALVSVNTTELKIVGICGGPALTVDNVLSVLQKAQEAQDHLMAEDEQFRINRTLREEQDREYEEALERDRLIEEQKSKEMEKVTKKSNRKEENEARKKELFEKFFSGENDPAGACTIVVRLPNGSRIDRCFNPETKIELLYDWVLCAGLLFPNAAEFGKKIFADNFVLSTSFPSARIDDKSKNFIDYGLIPNAVLSFSFTHEDDHSDLDQ